MPTFRFPLSVGSGGFSETVASMPPPVKSALGRGFKVLQTLSQESLQLLIRSAQENITKGRDADVSALAVRCGLQEAEVADALSAASFLIIGLALENVAIDAFIANGIQAGLFTRTEAGAISRAAESLSAKREEIKASVDQEEVANRILPSLAAFEFAVEMRIDFQDDRVSSVVPVAVAYLDTDATHMEVWFQMSKSQVERLYDDLKSLVKKMADAEAIIKRMKLDQ